MTAHASAGPAHGTPSHGAAGHGSHAAHGAHGSHGHEGSLEDYFHAQHTAEVSQARMYRLAREAYDHGLEAIGDDLSKLKTAEGRSEFMGAFSHSLESVINASAFTGEDDAMAKMLAMKGFYGFSAEDFSKHLEAKEDRLDFFEDYLRGFLFDSKVSGFAQAYNGRMNFAYAKLDPVPAEEILKYVHVEAAHPDKMRLQDKVEILKEFKDNKVVTPNFLKGKEYMGHEEHEEEHDDAHGSHGSHGAHP